MAIGLIITVLFSGFTQVGCDNGTTTGGPGGPELIFDENGFDQNGNHQITGKPYNTEGFKKDGTYWRDAEGYDFEGWDADGWNRDGIFEDTGTLYDNEGYDRGGYTAAGWNKAGNHKDTGKPHDTNGNDINGAYWRDENGYDYNGLDVNGLDRDGYDADGNDKFGVHKSVQPVNKRNMPNSNTVEVQSDAGVLVATLRRHLEASADATKLQFMEHGGTNPHFRDVVMALCDLSKAPELLVSGDNLINSGIDAFSKYLAEFIQVFTIGEERDNFNLIMDAFRTRAYVDARVVAQNDPAANPSQEELHDLYVQLAAAGVNVNAANFDMYINETLIPNISTNMNISPVLVQTLLNHITTNERAYASVDDIRALGFNPVMSGRPYEQLVPIRNLNFVRDRLNQQVAALNQNQVM